MQSAGKLSTDGVWEYFTCEPEGYSFERDVGKVEERIIWLLLWWLSSQESTCNAGDVGSIPGLGRSPGEGNSKPLQCSCLGNPMDRRAWQGTVHGVTKSETRLSR